MMKIKKIYVYKKLKSDRRISLIVNKKSLGAGFSRNLAIKIWGKFIGFLMGNVDNRKITSIEVHEKNFYYHTDYKIIDVNNKILNKKSTKKRISSIVKIM